jgi:ABC-type polysaccharide/polyol phosphate transport system ATPase subunit
MKAARGIVLVTHDMHWVTEFCNRAMLIEKGHVVALGEPDDVVRIHQEHSTAARAARDAELARLLAGAASART